MAKDITIRRYTNVDGQLQWLEFNPKTEISQVNGLQTALNGKQATLTFDSTPTNGSSNPVTSDGIFDSIKNVMDTAEGKNQALVTDAYKTGSDPNYSYYILCGSSSADFEVGDSISAVSTGITPVSITSIVTELDLMEYVYLYTIKEVLLPSPGYKVTGVYTLGGEDSSVKIGDILYITNKNLPDFWISKVYTGSDSDTGAVCSVLETSKVDLLGYITTNTTQTGLSGNKTFENSTIILNSNATAYQGETAESLKIDNQSITISDRGARAYGWLYKTSTDETGFTAYMGAVSQENNQWVETVQGSTKYGIGAISLTDSNNNTTTLTLPSSTGTLALTSDLSSKAPLASPTFTGNVELPTSVKIGSYTTTGLVKYTNGTLSVDTTSYVPTTRTVNGKALSSDITLSASDVLALPSSTAYLASVGLSNSNRTLTITPSSGSATSFSSGNITTLSDTAPSNAQVGDIWFEITS